MNDNNPIKRIFEMQKCITRLTRELFLVSVLFESSLRKKDPNYYIELGIKTN